MQERFSTKAIAVIIFGSIIIGGIVLYSSFSSFIYPSIAVNSVDEAKETVDQYIPSLGSNLRVREIMEFSNHFYVMVQEKDTGINALELLVDKGTGKLSYEPGPNMMWNTKYGHMGQRSDPTALMPVGENEALEHAQNWLDRNHPSARVEEAEKFYGYYTMDVSKDGNTYGMLSVNGYTGDVWYHTWHGSFIRMAEYD